jgi:predicted ATPase/DNA-binding CsgD family transcriptional regulator
MEQDRSDPPIRLPGEHMQTPPNNLPLSPKPLIGRVQELATIRAHLNNPAERLLTLTGTGGVGKTRLALQIAHDLLFDFVDGVYFIELAPVPNPELIVAVIAGELRESNVNLAAPGQSSIFELLTQYIQDKRMLLVLDNFEHLMPGVTLISSLLQACPNLKLVVTSRETLRCTGELEFEVLPLPLPDLKRHPFDYTELEHNEAVALFIERIREIRPDYPFTPAHLSSIARMSVRLDGLPLAIELAAARIKLLSPQQLYDRLGLQMLTGGARDKPERQQTLRNTLRWSYELLNEEEMRIFRRLGVFVGSFTLETMEQLCRLLGDAGLDVLAVLGSLLDKHLIYTSGGNGEETYFSVLETIREYALECLKLYGELEIVQQMHATCYTELAELTEEQFVTVEQARWFVRLEREYDNIRAALRWSIEYEQVELALRLSGSIWSFWLIRGLLNEGRQWVERVLQISKGADPLLRAKALRSAGSQALFQGDLVQGQLDLESALSLYRSQRDQEGIGITLVVLAFGAYLRGDYVTALMLGERGLKICRAVNNRWYAAGALFILACEASAIGDSAEADRFFHESLEIYTELGERFGLNYVLNVLAQLALQRGEYLEAQTIYEQCLPSLVSLNDRWLMAIHLRGLGNALAAQQQYELAARLWGTAEALREETAMPIVATELAHYEQLVVAARKKLGEQRFLAAWEEGRAMTADQILAAIKGARKTAPSSATAITMKPLTASRHSRYPDNLTRREVEVLCLLTQGLTNIQSAQKLMISQHTVNAHVRSIFSKINVVTRTAAIRYAFEHNLCNSEKDIFASEE